jgi:hypothetical protein
MAKRTQRGKRARRRSGVSQRVLASRKRTNHMLVDVSRILSLTPEERLREVANVSRFLAAARRG